MIDTLSSPFPPQPPVLGAALSKGGTGEVSTAATAAPATPATSAPASPASPATAAPEPEAPELSEEALPKAAAFPQVLESFFYRYQLDLNFSASSTGPGGESEKSLPGPELPPPQAPPPQPQSLPLQRSGAVEPGSRRAVIATAFREVRTFQARIFTQQSDQLAGQLTPATGDKLRQTSRAVARTFSLNFSLKASFLSQFSRQSQTLAGKDGPALGNYLDVSQSLSLSSGEDTQAFFDQVDQVMAQTEQTLQDGVGTFLEDMKGQLGLKDEDVQAVGKLLHEGIADFFSTAADFLNQAEAQLTSGAPAPEPPPQPVPQDQQALAA